MILLEKRKEKKIFIKFDVNFSGRKLALCDFDRHFKSSKYFPPNAGPNFADFGRDQYHLSGLFASNLAILTR